MIDLTKICSKCQIEQPLTNFSKSKSCLYGVRKICKTCINKAYKIYHISYYEKNHELLKFKSRNNRIKSLAKFKEYDKKRRLIKKYGISFEDKIKILESQNNKCKICDISLNIETNPKQVNVDHCHIKNKIRGILCRDCNLGLGHFKDSINSINRAIEYLNNENDFIDIRTIEINNFQLNIIDIEDNCKICNKCYKMKDKKHFKNGSVCYRCRDLYSNHGITDLHYEYLLNLQNKKCYICQKEYDKLFVDHNHQTNKIRGLLCTFCNSAIGHAKENINILNKFNSYILNN